jgi:hypothetical protein
MKNLTNTDRVIVTGGTRKALEEFFNSQLYKVTEDNRRDNLIKTQTKVVIKETKSYNWSDTFEFVAKTTWMDFRTGQIVNEFNMLGKAEAKHSTKYHRKDIWIEPYILIEWWMDSKNDK